MDTPTLEIASRVAAAMKREDRSRAWTADRAGIALTTFKRKLAGTTEFTPGELIRIGTALNTHPADFLPELFTKVMAA